MGSFFGSGGGLFDGLFSNDDGTGRNGNLGKYNRYILIAGIVAVVALFITVFRNIQSGNDLEVYNESNVVEEITSGAEMAADIDCEIHAYDEGFSISIPSDWVRVTKGGYDTYVHQPTGSSVQIQVLGYDPSINNVSAEEKSIAVAEDGMTFVSFTRMSTSSYELMYQDFKNATYDYIEEVYWDRSRTVRIVCTMDDAYYQDMAEYYEVILNSFAWDRESPIPEDLVLWYIETGDFEFAYPLSWATGESSGSVVAMNEDATAMMTVSVSEYAYSLESVTGSDMSGLIGTGRSNFMLNWYDASASEAEAEATYVSGNVQYVNRTYLFANGVYLYTISFDYESGAIDGSLPDECAGYFREFVSEKRQAEMEQELTEEGGGAAPEEGAAENGT